uniref:Zn(2)-C6 fungal-type domain-containing protein n=1 Tax=Kwoniella dejecticola CBS 10117 TaxID=1296121 RepID=A0A1A6A677_9TREE|nr:uncharacterized protein I303_04890 [Kwoniella dejecticola CBS 10117]OBR85554.1 hypothetical protein I303_04890 [Kwoniella dejecticola CBS 10117]
MPPEDPIRCTLACLNCRAAKAKCVVLPDAGPSLSTKSCNRCVKYGLECLHSSRRKRGTGPTARALMKASMSVQPPADDTCQLLPSSGVIPPTSREAAGRKQPSFHAGQGREIQTRPIFDPGSSGTIDTVGSGGQTDLSRRRQIDVTDHLDPHVGDSPPPLFTGEPGTWFDTHSHAKRGSSCPITPCNSRDSPDDLYASIEQQFVLLSSVLAVSAKFFRIDLSDVLMSHAQISLQRAIFAGECSISLIKALIVLVFWKDPADKSAWTKIGIALRLSYQLSLHEISCSTVTEQDYEQKRDGQRTWYCLSCMDRSYSDMFDLPVTTKLEEYGDIEGWVGRLANSPHNAADWHLASSMTIASAHHTWMNYKRRRHAMPSDWKRDVMSDLETQFLRHIERWFGPSSPLSAIERDFLLWYDYRLIVNIKFERLENALSSDAAALLEDTYNAARIFVDQTRVVAANGSLLYLQDATAVHLSSLGILLYKLFWKFSTARRRSVISMIQEMRQYIQPLADDRQRLYAFYIARFLDRLLLKIKVESRMPSRAASPADLDSSTFALNQQLMQTTLPQGGGDTQEVFPLDASLFPSLTSTEDAYCEFFANIQS